MTQPSPAPKPPKSQLQKDRDLLHRIDDHGVGLTPRETEMLESFLTWTERGSPLTEKQRKAAEDIDERRIR